MRFRGTVYRVHNLQWSWAPVSGAGARLHGGRFNRRGVPAFYSSLSPVTAVREAQPIRRPIQPLVPCAYDVDAQPVFDATDEAELRAVRADRSDLACATWQAEMLAGRRPASQQLAARLVALGCVGMLVRSFAVGAQAEDLNLVMWRWGNQHPVRVALIGDEDHLR